MRLEDLLQLQMRAPKASGRVIMLSNRPREGVHEPVEELHLCPDRGILGERWAETAWLKLEDGSPDPRVQVSMTNIHVMSQIAGSTDRARDCGDNLFVDFDLSEDNLPTGSQLLVGEVVLEVSDVHNDACGKFIQRFGKEVYDWIRDPENQAFRLRGIFCRIVQGGQVRVGDFISMGISQG